METVTDRIARFILARIRRRSVLDLYARAAVAGLLEQRFITGAEEGGTVWTVPTKTLEMLSGHPEHDHEKIGRHLAKAPCSKPEMRGGGFEFAPELPSDSDNPQTIAKRRPARRSPAAGVTDESTKVSSGDASAKMPDVLALLRQHLPRPRVSDVAVALLVAGAVGSSVKRMDKLRGVLRQPAPFLLIKAPVARFERRFASMLEDGLIMPFQVRIDDVYHGISLKNEHRKPPTTKPCRSVKLISGYSARRVGAVVLAHHLSEALNDQSASVVVVDETPLAPPPALSMTADVVFECEGLDHLLIAELLHLTLGIAPKLSLLEMASIELDVSGLSLDDLVLAIRPAQNLNAILATLATLGDVSRSRDDDDDSETGKTRSHDNHDRNGKSKNRRNGIEEAKRASSAAEDFEIIQPVDLTKHAPLVSAEIQTKDVTGGTDGLHHLQVETLSGYGEAKDWAIDLKSDLQSWREGQLNWSEISTKLLLSGPPGTGKTTFARALCNTLQVPLLVTSVASWLEPGYLGDVLKRMSQAFETARSHAPAILFIDELDNIGSRGGSRREQHDDYWRSLINRLLELLDGTSKTDGVIVVAATNLPEMIDPALLRSGRLEKHVVIPLPDVDALSGILAQHLAADLASVLSSAPPCSSTSDPTPSRQRSGNPQRSPKTPGRRHQGSAKGMSQ